MPMSLDMDMDMDTDMDTDRDILVLSFVDHPIFRYIAPIDQENDSRKPLPSGIKIRDYKRTYVS